MEGCEPGFPAPRSTLHSVRAAWAAPTRRTFASALLHRLLMAPRHTLLAALPKDFPIRHALAELFESAANQGAKT